MKKDDQEFQKFDATMTQLLKVPHSEIKEKLDAEKREKKRAPKTEENKPLRS